MKVTPKNQAHVASAIVNVEAVCKSSSRGIYHHTPLMERGRSLKRKTDYAKSPPL